LGPIPNPQSPIPNPQNHSELGNIENKIKNEVFIYLSLFSLTFVLLFNIKDLNLQLTMKVSRLLAIVTCSTRLV